MINTSGIAKQYSLPPWARAVGATVGILFLLTAWLTPWAHHPAAAAEASPSDVQLDDTHPDDSLVADNPPTASPAPSGQSCPVCRRPACFGDRLRLALRRCLRARRGCCRVVSTTADQPTAAADPYAWRSLFDGASLGEWKATPFGHPGEVYVEDGMIVMENGSRMTGITWTGEVARENYEIEYQGMRLGGVDFFATLTFPVGEDECSLVTGGWGGTIVGISTIDYYDASDNMTTSFHEFDYATWYTFRVRVTPWKIEAWIDDAQVVDLLREGREIDYRSECELSRPLGFATYNTAGAVRNIRLRALEPTDTPPPESDYFGIEPRGDSR